MNQETIENHIKNLGKADFDRLVEIILLKYFRFDALDVDGKGDAGSDFLVLNDEKHKVKIAVQKTIQSGEWQKKAISDARKAKAKLHVDRYVFITSKSHEQGSIKDTENKITNELNIPAQCYGAKELSAIIIKQNLLADFAQAINLDMNITSENRIDETEMLLHSYFILSNDCNNLNNDMIDNAIKIVIFKNVLPLTKDELINQIMNLLGMDLLNEMKVGGRIDSLLSKKKLMKTEEKFYLDENTKLELQISNGIYDVQLSCLAEQQTRIVESYGGQWSKEFSITASVYLAREYVRNQIQTAKHSNLEFPLSWFHQQIGEPINDLKNLIVQAGIESNLDVIIKEFVINGSDSEFIKKLIKSVIYVAMKSTPVNKVSIILGTPDWSNVTVILDASVAIPYICSHLFRPTTGRFSKGAYHSISTLKSLSVNLKIPLVYLQECAAHLIDALNYVFRIRDFDSSFRFSENGFVSHYFQLKSSSAATCPSTLLDYLSVIAPGISNYNKDNHSYEIKKLTSQIGDLFRDNSISLESIPEMDKRDYQYICTDFFYLLGQKHLDRPTILIHHDSLIMQHMISKSLESSSNKYICLTWDGIMIELGKRYDQCGWVISPHEICDIVQPKLNLSEGSLTSLAHSIASSMDAPSILDAQIMDNIIKYAKNQLEKWQFRKKFIELKEDMVKRIDTSNPKYREQIDFEIKQFLENEGIKILLDEGLST